MNHFVHATEMVNSLGLFSTNEELAELLTSELRLVCTFIYLFIFYLLSFALK